MKQREINKIVDLLYMTQEHLWVYVHRVLVSRLTHRQVFVSRQYIIAKGTIPVCVVAHMDIAKKNPDMVMIDSSRRETLSCRSKEYDRCLGADDRAGVYASLHHFLPLENRPTLIFTCEEEKGCIGTKNLIDTIEDLFPKVNEHLLSMYAFIQIDRRNMQDCVFYNDEQDKWVKYIEKFGFKETTGSFSDVGHLANHYGVCGVNLSAGYKKEHTSDETLHLPTLEATIEKSKKIIADLAKKKRRWILKPDPVVAPTASTQRNLDYKDCVKIYHTSTKESMDALHCEACGFPLLDSDEIATGYCEPCRILGEKVLKLPAINKLLHVYLCRHTGCQNHLTYRYAIIRGYCATHSKGDTYDAEAEYDLAQSRKLREEKTERLKQVKDYVSQSSDPDAEFWEEYYNYSAFH